MSDKLMELFVEIKAQNDKLISALREAEAKSEQSSKKMQSWFDRINFKGMLVGAFSIAAVTAAFRKLISAANEFRQAASRAQETGSKFNVVFRNLRNEASDWATDFSKSVGRAETDVKAWMGILQDTFVPLGFSRDKSLELSKALTKLAVDVASFNNAADDEVLRNFTSAIVGNHEAVRSYGIVITETELKNEALRQGITKNYNELTALEKAQLRFNIIMRSSTDAQGDAVRTSEEHANQVKRMHANLTTLYESIGDAIINNDVFNESLKATSDLADKAAEAIKGYNEAQQARKEEEAYLKGRGIKPESTTSQSYTAGYAALGMAVTPDAAVPEYSKAQLEYAREQLENLKKMNEEAQKFYDQQQEIQQQARDAASEAEKNRAKIFQWEMNVLKFRASTASATGKTGTYSAYTPSLTGGQATAGLGMFGTQESGLGLQAGSAKTNSAYLKQIEEINDRIKVLDAESIENERDRLIALEQIRYESEQKRLGEFSDTTEAMELLETEHLARVEQINKQTANNISSHWAMVSSILQSLMNSVISSWTAGFGTAANSFSAMLQRMLAELTAKAAIFAALSIIPGGSTILKGLQGLGVLGRASGGSVNSNTPYLVGERGPELFMPSRNGIVIPSELTKSIVNSNTYDNSSMTMNFNGGERGMAGLGKAQLAMTLRSMWRNGELQFMRAS